MDSRFEYMIRYRTAAGKTAGLYKGMSKEELDQMIDSLREDGCVVEKVEIIRRTGG
ncbi:hypothetical protein [Dethiobacter alkaliphilus]|uniref:Uncharacterized protein n=1 Tax=Dethiobacter alkaliphilus AHT 1 TaxID=555088 RepID=C0GK45_DETAL|nr:hypothetical protein [Dethiobacter alkaliphilus]EEG76315.1 hypothetical protein DealDRAFT_2854 [Dethiobacter alkaliphilus AHT 1]MCW3490929.1 hypothetical protein [Dethiobacter alkaliphilus]